MKIIILTGKSGSGKSYAAEELSVLLNAKHLPLDKISHQALATDELKRFVKKEFGTEVFNEDGSVNRKKIGAIAFSNPKKLDKLNKISEIIMEQIIDYEIQTCKQPYVILDYMLLPKMKYFKLPSIKILLTCDAETRKKRVIARDNILEDYFYAREQHALEFEPSDYDFVINSTNPINYENLSILIQENF